MEKCYLVTKHLDGSTYASFAPDLPDRVGEKFDIGQPDGSTSAGYIVSANSPEDAIWQAAQAQGIKMKKQYPDAWMQTYTGKVVYPLEFDSSMVCIEDIAWSLSHQCRFAGHSSRFYSVAEHCIHLLSAVPEHLGLAALLHDASEAYLVDVPRPVKWALSNYSDIEYSILEAIAESESIEMADFEAIKQYDAAILRDEKDALFPTEPRLWNVPTGLGLKNKIQAFEASMEEVYDLFLFHYNRLKRC